MAKKKVVKKKGAVQAAEKNSPVKKKPAKKAGEQKSAKPSWGQCRDCKWWQIEPAAAIDDDTLGLCIDEELQRFRLSVSGASGCNRYMPGEPARAKGSGAQPPTAKPTR